MPPCVLAKVHAAMPATPMPKAHRAMVITTRPRSLAGMPLSPCSTSERKISTTAPIVMPAMPAILPSVARSMATFVSVQGFAVGPCSLCMTGVVAASPDAAAGAGLDCVGNSARSLRTLRVNG